MTRLPLFGLAAALVAVSLAAADDAKPGTLDPAKLVGTWDFTDGMKDGEKLPKEKLKNPVTFTKDTISLKTEEVFSFKYTLDPAAAPAGIDLEITAPDAFKGAKAKGIVALDKDELKLSYDPAGGDRPKDFDAKKGSGNFSFVLKKSEKK